MIQTQKKNCGMIDGLAFLPVHCVKEGESILKEKVRAHLFDSLEYFDSSYVSGPYKSVQTAFGLPKLVQTNPRFVLRIWNVHEATIQGQH